MVRQSHIGTASDADSSMKNRKDSTRRPPAEVFRFPSPFEDPLRHIKRPLLAGNGRREVEPTSSSRKSTSWRFGTSFTRPSASSPACSGSVCRR
jgi:hypothetical protein